MPGEQPEQAATRPPARRGAAEPTVVSGKRHRQRRGRLEIAPRAEELGGAYSRIQPAVLRSAVSLSTPTGSPTARRGRAWSREDHMCREARRRGSSPIGGLGAGGAGAAAGGTSGCSGSPIKPSPHAKSPGAPSPYTLCGHVAAGYMCATPPSSRRSLESRDFSKIASKTSRPTYACCGEFIRFIQTHHACTFVAG